MRDSCLLCLTLYCFANILILRSGRHFVEKKNLTTDLYIAIFPGLALCRTKLQLTEWTKPEKVLSISSSSSWSWSWTYHNFFFRPIEPVMDEVVVAPKKFSKKKKWQLLKMDKLIGRRPKKQDRNISLGSRHIGIENH